MKTKSIIVKAVRQATGLNQQDFAIALGVSTSIVSKVESEIANADNLIVTISKKTGISLENITSGNIPKEIVIKSSIDSGWKDEAYQLLKDELRDWKAKHSEAMNMVSMLIQRVPMGKYKAFGLTANDKFVSRAKVS